jgi:prevent-host-death family protein
LELHVADDIVPIGELKAHLAERIRDLRTRRRPLVVTQNGKATAVLLSPEDFDRLAGAERVVAAVKEGVAQADSGEVVDHEEAMRILEARFAAPPQRRRAK